MTILSFDYGDSHIGIATGSTETGLAEPLITLSNSDKLFGQIEKIFTKYHPAKIIIGASESTSATKAQGFADQIAARFDIPLELTDETLSSQDAVKSLGHVSTKKRHQLEHAAAAAIILERWLDEQCQ